MRITASTCPSRSRSIQPVVTGILAVASLISHRSAYAQPSSTIASVSPDSVRSTITVEPARAKRMDAALESLSHKGRSIRMSAGAWSLLAGGLEIAGGVVTAFPPSSIQRHLQLGLIPPVLLALGSASVVAGIYALSATTTDEERYARWRALNAVDERTLARFEGELAAEAQLCRRLRIAQGVASIGVAVGGAAILAITPFTKLRSDAAEIAYLLGGTYVLLGVWQAITQLAGESANEVAYHRYQTGVDTDAAKALRLYPVLATSGAGASLAGAF
jgi:hypothetical protein